MGLYKQALRHRYDELINKRAHRIKRLEHHRAKLIEYNNELEMVSKLLSIHKEPGFPDLENAGAASNEQDERKSKSSNGVFESKIEDILNITGNKMHVSEIARELRNRNIPIPGSGSDGNIITRINRDERFIRVGRGTYELKEWGSKSTPMRKKTRKKLATEANPLYVRKVSLD